jgi:hypothetical protein
MGSKSYKNKSFSTMGDNFVILCFQVLWGCTVVEICGVFVCVGVGGFVCVRVCVCV